MDSADSAKAIGRGGWPGLLTTHPAVSTVPGNTRGFSPRKWRSQALICPPEVPIDARYSGVSMTAVRSGTAGASFGDGGGVVALTAAAALGATGAGAGATGVSDFWAGFCSGAGSRMKIAG